jgi:uncharacterized protein (DUF3820 family)
MASTSMDFKPYYQKKIQIIFSFLNWFDNKAWYPLGRIVGRMVGEWHSPGLC